VHTKKIIVAVTSLAIVAVTGIAILPSRATAAASRACASWELVPTPPLPSSESYYSWIAPLNSVSAPSPDDVFFTGNVVDNTVSEGGYYTGRVLHWDGHALAEAAQIPPITQISSAAGGVSSFDSASDGWSFPAPDGGSGLEGIGNSGIQNAGNTSPEAAYRWHNGQWTATPLAAYPVSSPPSPLGISPDVSQVAALSPDSAWAVGWFGNDGTIGQVLPLIEHWDGTQWSIIPSPAVAGSSGMLTGLTVVSPDNIWAVGVQNMPEAQTYGAQLIEHWDGSTWSIVPAPASADQAASALVAVSADSASDIWAVGGTGLDSSSSAAPLVEHWNGSTWGIQQVPGIGTSTITSVYAAGPDDVWAIAHPFLYSNPDDLGLEYSSVFLHWDGSTWTTVPLPGPQEYGLIYDYSTIAGSGPGDIWADGTAYDNGNESYDPLIAHLSCGR
jgi:hypothetical protein